MKKTFKIIISILLILLIGVNIYLGRLFLIVKEEKDTLINEKENIETKVSDLNNNIDELNNRISELENDPNNTNLVTEYTNWTHHLEKLKEIMDY